MEDNPTVETETQPVKSAVDLEIEKLKNEIAELKQKYETELADALGANRELWAELHPVKVESSEPLQDEIPKDEAEASFKKTLGIE